MFFEIGDAVEIRDTFIQGTIVGKAEYLNGTTSYYVRFVDHNGTLTKSWFESEDLDDVKEEEVLDDEEDFSDDEEDFSDDFSD